MKVKRWCINQPWDIVKDTCEMTMVKLVCLNNPFISEVNNPCIYEVSKLSCRNKVMLTTTHYTTLSSCWFNYPSSHTLHCTHITLLAEIWPKLSDHVRSPYGNGWSLCLILFFGFPDGSNSAHRRKLPPALPARQPPRIQRGIHEGESGTLLRHSLVIRR